MTHPTDHQGGALARRTVTGVIATMVLAVVGATAVGFWLSYGGLHQFALHAGLRGHEAWAWPASVDLFIAAGEAGVTIAALARRTDKMAWTYLILGAAASVTGNVLHVSTGNLIWTRYAAAAVPPIAAILALAALLRQVYRLASRLPAGLDTGRKGAGPADSVSSKVTARPAPARKPRPAARPAEDAARQRIRDTLDDDGTPPSERSIAVLLGGETRRKRAKALIGEELAIWQAGQAGVLVSPNGNAAR